MEDIKTLDQNQVSEVLNKVRREDDDQFDQNVVDALSPMESVKENAVDEFDKQVSAWMYHFATTTKKKYLLIRFQKKAIKRFGLTFKTEVKYVPELSNKKLFKSGDERSINLIRVRGVIIRNGIKSGAELLEYYKRKGTVKPNEKA